MSTEPYNVFYGSQIGLVKLKILVVVLKHNTKKQLLTLQEGYKSNKHKAIILSFENPPVSTKSISLYDLQYQ